MEPLSHLTAVVVDGGQKGLGWRWGNKGVYEKMRRLMDRPLSSLDFGLPPMLSPVCQTHLSYQGDGADVHRHRCNPFGLSLRGAGSLKQRYVQCQALETLRPGAKAGLHRGLGQQGTAEVLGSPSIPSPRGNGSF